MVHGQSQENQASRAPGPVARIADHQDAGQVRRLRNGTDAATAERQVAEEHKISETLLDRLVAIREDH